MVRAQTVAEGPQLSTMRRVCIAMLAGGGLTSGIGVWTTQETVRSQWWQGIVAVLLLVGAAVLVVMRGASRRSMEAAAFASLVLLGALIAGSVPLGMAPIFALWPVVLLAHFSSRRVAAWGYAAAVVALAVGLAVNTRAVLRFDTFLGTSVSVGLMAWLVASLTHQQAVLRGELAVAAATDPLTGLLNRRGFEPRIEQLMIHAEAGGDALTVAMFDLDHFKAINDAYGHGVGDDVLRHVADSLRRVAREADVVGRLGGEEFAVVLPGADLEVALEYATRAAHAIHEAPPAPVGSLSISAGLCSLDSSITSPSRLLALADEALYSAKGNGRGRAAGWQSGIIVDPRSGT